MIKLVILPAIVGIIVALIFSVIWIIFEFPSNVLLPLAVSITVVVSIMLLRKNRVSRVDSN